MNKLTQTSSNIIVIYFESCVWLPVKSKHSLNIEPLVAHWRKQNDTFAPFLPVQLWILPDSDSDLERANRCDHGPDAHFRSLIIPWSPDKGSLMCDNKIHYPIIKGKWVLLSCDNALFFCIITGKWALLSCNNEMAISWSRDNIMKKDSSNCGCSQLPYLSLFDLNK